MQVPEVYILTSKSVSLFYLRIHILTHSVLHNQAFLVTSLQVPIAPTLPNNMKDSPDTAENFRSLNFQRELFAAFNKRQTISRQLGAPQLQISNPL